MVRNNNNEVFAIFVTFSARRLPTGSRNQRKLFWKITPAPDGQALPGAVSPHIPPRPMPAEVKFHGSDQVPTGIATWASRGAIEPLVR
jgi:hypothetical protein